MPESERTSVPCRAVVIWIDWYAYHLARFRGLQEAFGSAGEVIGIELVGGAGVHAGMRFRETIPSGLPVRTLLAESNWGEASQIKLARLLWQQLTELNPELVLIPGYYTLPALAAALWARLHSRTGVLMTESTAGDHPRIAWKEWAKGAWLRGFFQWAVCGGRAHVQYLRQLGFPSDRIARFYNVVGNDAIAEGVAQLRATSSSSKLGLPDRFFLFVGRLAPEKNVRGLWTAWLRYRIAGGTWGLVFVGDGPDAPALHEAVQVAERTGDLRKGCCDHVVFAGHRSAAELLPFYAFASCFVLPSSREPWGLVVNEAMAAGLPVIVSNRCGCARTLVDPLPAFIHGGEHNGLIFDPANEQEFVDCLQRIAMLPETEREALGQSSQDRITDYSPSNFGREIEAISRKTQHSRSFPFKAEKGKAW